MANPQVCGLLGLGARLYPKPKRDDGTMSDGGASAVPAISAEFTPGGG